MGVSLKTVYRWEKGEIEPRKAFLKLLEARVDYKRNTLNQNPDFTFIDLFAGIGGIRKGFESVGGECIFTSEWDEYARRTYRANFPDDHEITGDITNVEATDIPPHDVLLAGFPCQPFSKAGTQSGFDHKIAGNMFSYIMKFIT